MHVSPRAAARLSYVAAFGAVGAWYPYLAVFYQERGLDLGLIGLMTALGAAAGLVSAPIWGALADRFAGSPLIIPVASLVTAAGAIGLALSDSVGGMAAALVLSSVAFAGIAPTLDARALETVGDDRNRYGGLRAWGSGAFIVVVAFTGALVERAGITSMFIVYVAALLVLAVVSLPLRGDAGAPRLPRLDAIGVVLRHPPLFRFLRLDFFGCWRGGSTARGARRARRLGVGDRRARRDPDHGRLSRVGATRWQRAPAGHRCRDLCAPGCGPVARQ